MTNQPNPPIQTNDDIWNAPDHDESDPMLDYDNEHAANAPTYTNF